MTKKYKIRGKNKEITALNNVNLKIKNNEIFGLLGPNGAGKTTLVSILTTLIQPTSGYAIILGHNILKESWFIRENVGLMLGGEMIYHRLTGYKNLKYYSKLYGIKDYQQKIGELAEKFNLSNWMNHYVGNYSTGMKLKLALMRVLLVDPKILILDEPTLGLDPKSVKEVIKILKAINKTILITSHQMNVVQALCNRIAFLNKGIIIKTDTQENFKALISDKIKLKIRISSDRDILLKNLKKLDFISNIKIINDFVYFMIENEKFYPKILELLKNYPITKINEIRPKLEDIFIKFST